MPTFEFFLDSRGLITKEFDIDVTATLPKVTVQVFDGDTAVDLTGATVLFTLRDAAGAAVVLDAAAVLLNATQGIVEYQLKAADVDDVGFFFAQFKITVGSDFYLVPNDSVQRLRLRIGKEDLPAFSSVPASLPVHAGSHDLGGSDQIALEALHAAPAKNIYVDGSRSDSFTADGSEPRPFKTIEAGLAAVDATRQILRIRPLELGFYILSPAQIILPLDFPIYMLGDGHVNVLGQFVWQPSGPLASRLYMENIAVIPTGAQTSGLKASNKDTPVATIEVDLRNCYFGAFAITRNIEILNEQPAKKIICRVRGRALLHALHRWVARVFFQPKNIGDVIHLDNMSMEEDGFESSADAIAAEIRFERCRIKHGGIIGGNPAQVIRAMNCYTDAGTGALSTLDALDFQGLHSYEVVDGFTTFNEIHTLSLTNTSDTIILIPAGAIVSKVTVRVIDDVVTSSGTDTFDVGVVGATTRYGAGLAGAAGTERDQGPSDNQLFYGPAVEIRLSAPGVETFTAGKISVAITHSAPKEGQSGITAVGVPSKINTGSYTGDGSEGLAITGVGFQPKYVKIWRRVTSSPANIQTFETTDVIIDDIAGGGAIRDEISLGPRFISNQIISLDADGFTVDDGGTNQHPNTSGVTYNYLAIG